MCYSYRKHRKYAFKVCEDVWLVLLKVHVVGIVVIHIVVVVCGVICGSGCGGGRGGDKGGGWSGSFYRKSLFKTGIT